MEVVSLLGLSHLKEFIYDFKIQCIIPSELKRFAYAFVWIDFLAEYRSLR